jgi:hypothetical protein
VQLVILAEIGESHSGSIEKGTRGGRDTPAAGQAWRQRTSVIESFINPNV